MPRKKKIKKEPKDLPNECDRCGEPTADEDIFRVMITGAWEGTLLDDENACRSCVEDMGFSVGSDEG